MLSSSSQYRPKAPYAVSSKKYAADFNEVKSLGRFDSTTRTDEQTEIALFWVEGAPQGWNRIARTVSVQHGLDLWQNARLFGLLNLASADAYIADFENKYFYEFWRPITAIRARRYRRQSGYCRRPDVGFVGVDRTRPGVPLQDIAGREARCQRCWRGSSATRSASVPPPRRSRASRVHSRASLKRPEENANSRIYVGFHFRHATIEGLKLGSKVGKVAFNHYLQPVH